MFLGLGLTLISLLPFNPQGPFDARTFEAIPGIDVHFSWAGAMLEPISAIGHALIGAPIPKLAAIASLIWVLIISFVWGFLWRKRNIPFKILTAGGTAFTALIVFLAYTGLYFIFPFPSWNPITDKPGFVIADLHTHTHYSHDSIISPEDNLRIQGRQGIEITAITEHKDPTGSFNTDQLSRSSPEMPLVIPGVELRTPYGYILGLGLEPGKSVPQKLDSQQELVDFVQSVHKEHAGVAISLGVKLDRSQVEQMVQAGVDGFEITNMGHPDLPLKVRSFIKQLARDHNLTLVSSSDWHGWTGMWRTWTLVRVSDRHKGNVKENLLETLRDPCENDVIPVVAGYLGPTSSWRVAFAPFVEVARYASELSPKRVLSWWLWIAVAFIFAGIIRYFGLSPAHVIGRTSLVVIGALLLWKTSFLAFAPAATAEDPFFHREIGRYGLMLGFLTLILGAGPLLWYKVGFGINTRWKK